MDEPSQVTLRDVAKAAGVSAMTVSLALRDDPRIRPARRKVIQAVAQKMRYSPNAMAVAMAQQRRKVSPHPIAAELAWLNHWKKPAELRHYKEFDLYWRGAVAAATENGFGLGEFVVNGSFTYARLEQILLARNIQGIVIPPHGGAAVTHPKISSMDWNRFSVVRLGYSIPNFPAYVVAGNYAQSSMLAFSQIWKLGYRRIGYVCHWHTSNRAKAGYLLAQTEVELKHRVPILEWDIHSEHYRPELLGWLREHKPDAILTEVTETANTLKELGYRVPEDIGLAAISVLDGNSDAGIYHNSEEIGRTAIETVIGLIHQHKTGLPKLARDILVDARWQNGSMLPDKNFNVKTSALLTPVAG